MADRTIILTGAYGSGKTECAMALAVELAAHEAVTLVDLDFVNPYFRTLDHREALMAAGIRVVAPSQEFAPIDAPALPAEAREVIVHPRGCTLVDLGGDPAGAVVIGQFAPSLVAYDLWAVVNFSRPQTPDPPEAAAWLREVIAVTRLRLTGLVSNTHMGEFTTVDDILTGLAQAQRLGELLDVPVVLACAPAGLALPSLSVPTLAITRRLRKPWE